MGLKDKLRKGKNTNVPEGADVPENSGTTYKERKAHVKKNKLDTAPPEKLSRAEMKSLKQKRKELRKDLRRQGIKKKSDFELFANEVGLGLPKGSLAGMMASAGATLSSLLGIAATGMTVVKAMALALAVLCGIFLVSYITEEKGRFTINLTADMLREGFELSDTEDFNKEEIRLFAEEISNSNATSIYEINRGIHTVEGSHNGPGYLAYTFYLRNAGTMATNYGYTMNLLSDSLHTSRAAWVMFFEDDKQIVYAEQIEPGKPENLYGYPQAPFIETAYDPERQYTTKDGKHGIVATPFIDEYTVLQGLVEDFQPGEVKKYTVVVWLEGDDPDCNNDILGGHVGFNIQFDRLGEESGSYFKGLFRTDYDDFYEGKTTGLVDINEVTDDLRPDDANEIEERE